MRFWYLSHRRPAKSQASLRICAVSPEPLLFAYKKYGNRRMIQPKIRCLALLDGCACVFEEGVYGRRNLMRWSNLRIIHVGVYQIMACSVLGRQDGRKDGMKEHFILHE